MSSMTFETWMIQVDSKIDDLCGLSSDDIGDIDYYARWMDGKTPLATAKEAMRESGWRG